MHVVIDAVGLGRGARRLSSKALNKEKAACSNSKSPTLRAKSRSFLFGVPTNVHGFRRKYQ